MRDTCVCACGRLVYSVYDVIDANYIELTTRIIVYLFLDLIIVCAEYVYKSPQNDYLYVIIFTFYKQIIIVRFKK